MRFLLFLTLTAVFAIIGYNKIPSGWDKAKSSTNTKPTGPVKSNVLTEEQMKFKAEYCNAKLSSLKAHCKIYIQKFNQASKPEEIITLNRDFFPPLDKFNCWEI